MALNGTPWHFERLAVNVDGIGEVMSRTSRWIGILRSVASRPPIVSRQPPRNHSRHLQRNGEDRAGHTGGIRVYIGSPSRRGCRRDHCHVLLRARRGRHQVADAVSSSQQR